MHINKHFKKDIMMISTILVGILSGLMGFYLGLSSSKRCARSSMNKSILDHVSVAVKNFDESVKFYDDTLSILGYERLMTFGKHAAGYGKDKKPSFWIITGGNQEHPIGEARGLHIAFIASTVEDIRAWYDACLEHGGKSNGAPGQRTQYHPGYYAGFIIDPNGWHLEAVMHNYKPA